MFSKRPRQRWGWLEYVGLGHRERPMAGDARGAGCTLRDTKMEAGIRIRQSEIPCGQNRPGEDDDGRRSGGWLQSGRGVWIEPTGNTASSDGTPRCGRERV